METPLLTEGGKDLAATQAEMGSPGKSGISLLLGDSQNIIPIYCDSTEVMYARVVLLNTQEGLVPEDV